ncbi:MAG: M23 family metallopeptidase [Maribacter sp.]|uniref:M23 family metallopeptidase n=1 Tax=Maribacter sp. TaxID=1897614 RepID=UPI00329A7AF2
MMKSIIRLISLFFILVLAQGSCIKETPRPPAEIGLEEVNLGCDSTKYADWETSEYILPFPVGKAYAIGLSHCSGSYHGIGLPDQFAIDFNMDIGTKIIASRAGEVIFVEESGYDGEFPNNKVVIQHADGTYLQYMHLTHNGAAVEVGQRINKGQLIAYSGSTGLAGYPHLHFVATVNDSWEYPYTSFPTTFSNTRANGLSLRQGERYKALPY